MKAPIPIDEKRLEACVMLGASNADLALMFDLSIAALRRRFGKMIQRMRAERRAHIRRLVWESAKGGNSTLLAWLGKTELGWTEIGGDLADPPAPRRSASRFDFQAFAAEFEKLNAEPIPDRETTDDTRG